MFEKKEENLTNTFETFYYLTLLNFSRTKFYTWSEVFAHTGLTPTEIESMINTEKSAVIDPTYSLTQSAKNYNPLGVKKMLTLYSEKKNFEITSNDYGVYHSGLTPHFTPEWGYFIRNDAWFWKQHSLLRHIHWLNLLPSIKKVYLISSVSMKIATERSDIDLMIQCHPLTVPLTRVIVKSFLKIVGWDVHPFYLEILLFFVLLLRKVCYYFSSNTAIKKLLTWSERSEIWIVGKIFKFKNLNKTRIDAGIFFEAEQQVQYYYTQEPRQRLWLWGGGPIMSSPEGLRRETQFLSCFYQYRFNENRIWRGIIWCILLCISVVLFPFSFLQIPFYYLKNGNSPNYVYKFNFMGFIPRIYRSGNFIPILK